MQFCQRFPLTTHYFRIIWLEWRAKRAREQAENIQTTYRHRDTEPWVDTCMNALTKETECIRTQTMREYHHKDQRESRDGQRLIWQRQRHKYELISIRGEQLPYHTITGINTGTYTGSGVAIDVSLCIYLNKRWQIKWQGFIWDCVHNLSLCWLESIMCCYCHNSSLPLKLSACVLAP